MQAATSCDLKFRSTNLTASTARPTNGMSKRVNVLCGYRSMPSSFRNGVSVSRADWQSSCAILSSKVASVEDPGGLADKIAVVNGHKNGSVDLSLVPVETTNGKLSQVQPLTITDLSPAPLHGSNLRVAYQGVPGAYSEAAAGKAYPNCEAIPCDQFDVAFQAVELWIADRAVLPVENSLGGSIHRNYDLLLRHRLHIVGEVQIPVHHCLLALPGVRTDCVSRVISHPQALAQTERSLDNLTPRAAREAFHDTAAAAEYIAANNLHDTAATTRETPFKTSIVFAAQEHKGTSVLFKVLSAFAFRNISLTKIESRPHHNRPLRVVGDGSFGTAKNFEYMFYVDFEASMAETRAQNALSEVQEYTSFLRVLGSYPMDMTPWSMSPTEDA
ncbi:BnaA06g19810D [Brassica napus]|uniref:arogenate dehydratase n=1 Tax=Brassica napus TaxID=3708 RepID=A0A078H0C7_BRANA|nr:BnaA06g19810D [Brassica napus]